MVLGPDGRIFIIEKNGSVRIVRDQQLLPEPFLKIEVDDSNERGLGHMVLHPSFELNGYCYVYYTVPGQKFNRISRFTAQGDKVVPGSEEIILDLDIVGSDVHNGGAMFFGDDGYLYVSVGDGAQHWRVEDLAVTNGKLLCMTDEGEPVPDNPWYNLGIGKSAYVFAYGLRNPFTMAKNPQTGQLYFNDVGGGKSEEINKIEKGAFYGWPRVEGKRVDEEVPASYRDPIYQYGHTNGYCCIVGATFYLPEIATFPTQYHGKYFFSDYCTGRIRMLNAETGQVTGTFITDGDRVVDMAVSNDGSFYYLERRGLGDGSPEDNSMTNNGVLWRVMYTGSGAPFISTHPQSLLVSIGETAIFKVKSSGVEPLSFTWLINDEETSLSNTMELHIPDVAADMDGAVIKVRVSNASGQVLSQEAILSVTSNQRPDATILTPSADYRYRGGDMLIFNGEGTDPEDGQLDASKLSWKIDFHHGTHSHPAMPWTSGISGGEWFIPELTEIATDVYYRIHLQVSDQEGLLQTVTKDISPVIGSLMVNSSPMGLDLEIDGTARPTPATLDGVEGVTRYISAPLKQVRNDSIYFFDRWSDGFADHHREVSPSTSSQVYTAVYSGILKGRGSGLSATFYDNPDLEGVPVASRHDSIIDFQYYLNAPQEFVPEDFFSVQWEGYIQPYRTGNYHFFAFSDDGMVFEIDEAVVLDRWEPGAHYVSGQKYLTGGRLYPVKLRWFEQQWGAYLKLRWSSDDFAEETIPSSQLYPAGSLSKPLAKGVIEIKSLIDDRMEISLESYEETNMHFMIVSADGRLVKDHTAYILPGKSIVTIYLKDLAPGIYILSGIDAASDKILYTKFAKALR